MDYREQMNNGYYMYNNKPYKIPPVDINTYYYCHECETQNVFTDEQTYNNIVDIAFSGVVYEDLLDQNNN